MQIDLRQYKARRPGTNIPCRCQIDTGNPSITDICGGMLKEGEKSMKCAITLVFVAFLMNPAFAQNTSQSSSERSQSFWGFAPRGDL